MTENWTSDDATVWDRYSLEERGFLLRIYLLHVDGGRAHRREYAAFYTLCAALQFTDEEIVAYRAAERLGI